MFGLSGNLENHDVMKLGQIPKLVKFGKSAQPTLQLSGAQPCTSDNLVAHQDFQSQLQYPAQFHQVTRCTLFLWHVPSIT